MTPPRRKTGTQDARARIDEMMETASQWLAESKIFDAERTSLRALMLARRHRDFERMARICLPLQEARRLRRQQACDARVVTILESTRSVPRKFSPGCYLVQPPMIGADARLIRESALSRSVPVFVLAREPMTQSRRWPVVAVAQNLVIRTQVTPPPGVRWTGEGVRRDELSAPVPVSWFEAAAEALGDAAIERVKADDPPQWRVDDLLEFLEALPEHERLHQALEAACREAIGTPEPLMDRRRGVPDDPFCF